MSLSVSLWTQPGIAPSHATAERGSLPITRLLLEFGVEQDSSSAAGEVPLHFAASEAAHAISRYTITGPAGAHDK